MIENSAILMAVGGAIIRTLSVRSKFRKDCGIRAS